MNFDPHPDLTPDIIFGLGWIYLILAAMNLVWTVRAYKQGLHSTYIERMTGQRIPSAGFWGLYSVTLLCVSAAHLTGTSSPEEFLMRMPEFFKTEFDTTLGNSKLGPVLYFVASVTLFGAVVWFRRWLVQPTVAWVLLNLMLLFMALSLTDYDFRQIVGKPDNVPIVSMLFIVAFFTWLYFKRSVENDDRIAADKPVMEAEKNEKVLVWPDLVYTEMICMIVLTVVLVVWGIVLQAPLEEPSSLVKTPNPSKAPWYFLGLQEMLVYYDPWLAGVVFPSLIVVGLMAIPYIDFNKKGSGYYTFNERKLAVITFMLGFLPLWVAMIILGTFLRGPNWNIFGFYEYWDVHKLEVLSNVNLSEFFWVFSPWAEAVGGLPRAASDASAWNQLGVILLRESPGIVAVLAYFIVLPPLMAATVFRKFLDRMGFIRYMVFANLLLWMVALPLKMVLRWGFNLKYLVAIPEVFFNI